MKLTITLLLVAMVAALPLAAATMDTAKFAGATGVRLDGGAKVKVAEGQTLTGKVVKVAELAGLGLKGAKDGEVVRVTWHGKTSFSFLHVPSGRRLDHVDLAKKYGEPINDWDYHD